MWQYVGQYSASEISRAVECKSGSNILNDLLGHLEFDEVNLAAEESMFEWEERGIRLVKVDAIELDTETLGHECYYSIDTERLHEVANEGKPWLVLTFVEAA